MRFHRSLARFRGQFERVFVIIVAITNQRLFLSPTRVFKIKFLLRPRVRHDDGADSGMLHKKLPIERSLDSVLRRFSTYPGYEKKFFDMIFVVLLLFAFGSFLY